MTWSCCFGVSANVTGTTSFGSASACCTPRPPFSWAWPTSMMRAAGTTTVDLRLDAAVGVALEGADDVDHRAGADLARHAGLGVDEDRDLALARAELGRGDQHPLLQQRVGGQVGAGDEPDELRAAAQRGLRGAQRLGIVTS